MILKIKIGWCQTFYKGSQCSLGGLECKVKRKIEETLLAHVYKGNDIYILQGVFKKYKPFAYFETLSNIIVAPFSCNKHSCYTQNHSAHFIAGTNGNRVKTKAAITS